MDGKALCRVADHLFSKKKLLDSFHQEVAQLFYPERAEFMYRDSPDYLTRAYAFAADNSTSYPALMRRELGNQISMMLRPKTRQWFHIGRLGYEDRSEGLSHEARQYLDHFEVVQRRAMYDARAKLTRACRVGDHDFATFGQCVLSLVPNRDYNRLLYQSWHLRDCAWQENEEGDIGFFARKWKPTAHVAVQTFKNSRPGLHRNLIKMVEKDKERFKEVELYHFVVDTPHCPNEDPRGRPRFSVWYDKANDHVIEYAPIWGRIYIVPRWVTINSQYAHSPAVTCAIADARLLEAITWTLLEVSEKSANPPMLATKDAVLQTPAVFAGGITWLDREYDERFGDAMRPFPQDYSGARYGFEMNDRVQALIKEAFFLNKLSPFNPSQDPQMTAFQAGQLVQEYVRNALPIFEPMEMEYNAALCEETFGLMTRMGGFGSPLDWPKELHDLEIEFQFESPLHDAIDREKGTKWLEAQSLLAQAVELDPTTRHLIDARGALRDALDGMGIPTDWTRSEYQIEEIVAAEAEEQELMQGIAAAQPAADAAKSLAEAGKVMAEPAQGRGPY